MVPEIQSVPEAGKTEGEQIAVVPAPAAKEKVTIQTGFTYVPILVDLSLRFLAVWGLSSGHLKYTFFWIIQLVVIPGGILYWQGQRDEGLRKVFGVPSSSDYTVAMRPLCTLFILAITVHNTYQAVHYVHIDSRLLRISIDILLGGVACIYTFGLGFASSTDERVDQEPDAHEAFDPADENDRLLTRLQTELSDLTHKVESYTIESTLIGAISFSAFVTIVTTEKGSMKDAHRVLGEMQQMVWHPGNWHQAVASGYLAHVPGESSILSMVALAALVCSMFFMVVIAARIRFNSLIGAASFSTEMAANFNAKEDDIDRYLTLNGGEHAKAPEGDFQLQRMLQLRRHIASYLEEARVEVDQIKPTITYMTISRTLGLLAFLSTLIVSALWFAPVFSGLFAFVATITFAYPWLDAKIRDGKLRKLDFFRLEHLIHRQRS